MRAARLYLWLFSLALGFTATLVSAATVTTLPPTGFAPGSATLNAAANPAGSILFGHFEYGPTTSYGTQTGDQMLGDGNNNVNFSLVVTGLVAGQIYHYRADVVILNNGTINGNDQSFFMPGAPRIATAAAGPIHPGQATLNAAINPLNTNSPTTWWFQHGVTTNYGSVTPAGTILSGVAPVGISELVTGLPRGVTYHFCAVASNAFGQAFGSDLSFSAPQGPTAPGGSTGGGQPFDSLQPCLELNFILCTNGVYPGGTIGSSIPLLGEICLFAGNFVPAGWTPCNGQLLNISNNTALFSLLGTTYGGDGHTNFALPNFQGNRPVEAGQGTGLQPWTIGVTNGSAQETLLVKNLPSHTHSLPLPDSATGTTGSGLPRANIQPSLAVNYLIALQGIYPTPGTATIAEPFLGQVFLNVSGGNLIPTGSAPLNGQVMAINGYQALFSVMGTTYGGDGIDSFDLPNLQSRVPVGPGQGQMSQWSLAQEAGLENVATTTAQMPAHQHTVPALGIVTGFTGSNQPQTLIQPSLVLQCLISTNGQIPSPTVSTKATMMGEIQLYAGTNLPGGWLPCDGSLMPISSNPGLFGVISNWFGGDGVTTFALPNLCGRVPVGCANGQPGAAYGAEQVVLAVANLPPHTHPSPVLDFDRWITSFGLSGAAAGFSADADADQTENGYEWATGSNPTNAQSLNRLTISSTHTNALIGFPRNTNAIDVVFTLLRSTNLANSGAWTAMATNTAGVWTPPAIATESGSGNPVNATISDALTNAPAANYRLQINWP